MSIRRSSILFALALAFSGTAPTGKTLRVHQANEKVLLDWFRSTSEGDLPLILNLQEGLTTLTSDLKIKPAIAESWSYDETGTVIHFLIRKNVFWSDGKPVTARDFIEGFQALLNRAAKNPLAYLLFDIRGAQEYFEGKYPDFSSVGISTTQENVLKIQLKEPNWQWVEKTAMPALFPAREEVISQKGASWTLPGNLINNGPYTLVSQTAGSGFVLRANPHYRLSDVKTRDVRFEICSFEEAIQRAGIGEMDLLLNVPHRYEAALRATGNMRIIPNQPNRVRKIDFNLKRYPTTLPDIRKALVQAIDRADLVATLDKRWIAASSWQLPWMTGFSKTAGLPFNRSEARRLFAQYFPVTQDPIKLTMLVPNFDESRGEQVEIANYLKKKWEVILGTAIEIIVADTSQQYTLLRDGGDYNLLLRDFNIDSPDPLAMYEPYATGSKFGYQWKEPEFDEGIKQSRRIRNLEKRKEVLRKLDDFLLVEQAAVFPLFYKGDLTAVSNRIHGFTPELWRDYGVKGLYFGPPTSLSEPARSAPAAPMARPAAGIPAGATKRPAMPVKPVVTQAKPTPSPKPSVAASPKPTASPKASPSPQPKPSAKSRFKSL